MIFLKGTSDQHFYCKLWSIDLAGKFPKGRITTSEKDQNGEWINSNWFVTFLGEKCVAKAKKLEGTERMEILTGKITNVSKKLDDGSYKNYLNFAIFDFKVQDGNASSPKRQEQEETVEEDTDDLPY